MTKDHSPDPPNKLKEVQIPGTPEPTSGQTASRTGLFPELKVQKEFKVQALARDGVAPKPEPIGAEELSNRVVELEFENGQRLWISGRQLLEKLAEEQRREEAVKERSGIAPAATKSDSVLLPTVWSTDGASRGLVGQLVLKGLKIIGFDPASQLAKGIARFGVSHIEDQLIEGTLKGGLAQLNRDNTFDQESGDCSGWLFPFGDDLNLKVDQQIKDPRKLQSAEPYLLFIHGTASSSPGSFGKLAGTEEWRQLRDDYKDRIIAFEHRSLSASPIKNVLDLVELLPDGARLHVVTHSRGGLVGELLCLSQAQRDGVNLAEVLSVFDKGDDRSEDSQKARDAQREMLGRLWEGLAKKRLRVERFVRVACPARGTTWLADNLDYFFSALLHCLELVPGLTENPIYDFVKATITSLVEMRAKPEELPGLEAMMPSSPLIAFLNHPDLVTAADLAVITGDSRVGLKASSILTILTKTVLMEKNDWVVNTRAMDGGMRREGAAWQFFDEGSDVNHFSYFLNPDTRRRMAGRLALRVSANEQTKGFGPLTRGVGERFVLTTARSAVSGGERGTVFVLPGIMGSQLQVKGQDTWINYLRLLRGGMSQLAIAQTESEVQPVGLMANDYRRLVEQLSRNYRVVPFAYDWRQSVKNGGEKLSASLREALAHTDRPVHLLAHSMGGLVARSMLTLHPDLWQEIGKRQGRLVMLGTPNNGSHAIVRMLLGDEKLLSMLALLDLKHDLKALLAIIREYPGVIDLLPEDYLSLAAWEKLDKTLAEKRKVQLPNEEAIRQASVWRKKLNSTIVDPARIIYVAGTAERTPIGLRGLPDGGLEITETTEGDGRVTYESGKLDGVINYYTDVIHGDLADTPAIFPALLELLEQGRTERLPRTSRAQRGAAARVAVSRAEIVEPVFPTEEDILEELNGGRSQAVITEEPPYTLRLSVVHGHLRHAKHPVAVGHYIGDGITSSEAALDRELDGRLSRRHRANLYPGPVGTAEVVYTGKHWTPPGALVIGLGQVGETRAEVVRNGVKAAALKHALLQAEMPARPGETGYRSAAFSSLLIGTHGGRALSVEETINAIVEGAVQANRTLQAQNLWDHVRIDEVEFIEIYEEIASLANHAVHRLRLEPPAEYGDQVGIEVVPALLRKQPGGRFQRLYGSYSSDWWRKIQIVSVGNETGAAAAKSSSPELLRLLGTNPGFISTQQQMIRQLVDDAVNGPEQRRFLTQLISDLLTQNQAAPAADESLEFTVLTDRARAEGRRQATQRTWVDQLIRGSVSDTGYKSELATTLFELLVPNDLKQQTENVALVLDRQAAQYPWELLVERSQSDRPLVTQIGMLRQFKSVDFRLNPQSSRGRNALVVGDSAGHGYGELFGAQEEAQRVAAALKTSQYEVSDLIKQQGIDIVTSFFAREYKIIHIAAHGVFELGDEGRQGIVLGRNQFLTTAELVNLRAVPDLVFINCCHLGRIETADEVKGRLNTEYPHRLAASIAEELIKIGVKAVVAAGWAVDDAAALTFANEFYREMLDGESFGLSVLRARRKTYQKHGATNTWGAYQCYGDPNFKLEQSGGWGKSGDSLNLYSRREYIDELRSITEQSRAATAEVNASLIGRINRLSANLPPELCDGELLSDLGLAWSTLGVMDKAVAAYQDAVKKDDAGATLKNIEQIANLYCRIVDRKWYEVEATKDKWVLKDRREGIRQLEQASKRLQWLNDEIGETTERTALLGRVYKSLALIAESQAESQKMLRKARDHYQQASESGVKNGRPRDNYPTFNWLACLLLLGEIAWKPVGRAARGRKGGGGAMTYDRFEKLLKECEDAALAKLSVEENFWVRVTLPDAALLKHLHSGSLLEQKSELIAAYQKAFATSASPNDVDSALSQMRFLHSMLNRQANTPEKQAVVNALSEIRVMLLNM
jgi:CHAT domain-containing protein/pimeloyl-ACP methyl ester carboxylesterase